MNNILAILCFILAIAVMITTFPVGVPAVLTAVILSTGVILILQKLDYDTDFLIHIFLIGLLARILFGTIIHAFEATNFFGSDALNYDEFGVRLVDIWTGASTGEDVISQRASNIGGPGWGMNYLVGIIYLLAGKNMLAGQFVCAVFGAATAPLVYICSYDIFKSKKVGQIAAYMTALFPAFILWSSQMLKDGLNIFLLVLAMTMVLQMQKQFSFVKVAVLAFSLFGILSLRFYVFYMVAAAVAGSFIIGVESSVKTIVRGFVGILLVGLVLAYLGVLQTASGDLERYGSLERVQLSRLDLSRSANSGFGEDLDVSTPAGALAAMPIGFAYLMFAPFPWEISNLRQLITLPEMLVWWASIPLLVTGLWFTIKNKLRSSIAILLFTLMLTLAYSVFQGNVGTAYRQRAQIQVFLFIFIGVGTTLFLEKRENKLILKNQNRKQHR